MINGIGLDKDDHIYAMYDGARYLNDKPYPNRQAGTVVKFQPRGAEWGDVRVLSSSQNSTKRYVPFVPMPLAEGQLPKRLPDIADGIRNGGKMWMTGVEWFYGGAGIMGAGCNCFHTRFCIDSFARSIVPEPDLYSVAVVDTAGNLVVRAGQYGNVDDPGPSLFYPAYVASDTDRRIFVSDLGNARILSLKLGYYAEEKVALKDVADAQKK
jgi:hypothetical protein